MTIEDRHNGVYRLSVSGFLTMLLAGAFLVLPPLFSDTSLKVSALYIGGAAFASFLYMLWFGWRAWKLGKGGNA